MTDQPADDLQQPPAGQDSPGAQPPAELPGWAPQPEPAPGPRNPDQIPDGEAAAAATPTAAADSSSSPESTSPALDKLSARGLTQAASAGFKGLGEGLHALSRDEGDLWLVADDEAQAVGEPLGRLLARRVPDLPAGGEASDVADGIAAAIPAAIWLFRNGIRQLAALRDRKRKPTAAAAAQPAAQVAQVTED
jgi:hypothetical protein